MKSQAFRPQPLKWRRQPHPWESHVNFAQVNEEMDKLEARFFKDAEPLLKRLNRRARKRLERPLTESLRVFSNRDKNDLRDYYFDKLEEYYPQLGELAANEIYTNFVPSDDVLDVLKQEGEAISFASLDNINRSIARKIGGFEPKEEGDKLDPVEIFGQVRGLVESSVKSTGSVAVATTISETRTQVFDENEDDIFSYTFSSVLDGRVCPICSRLDGMNVSPETYKRSQWITPIHHHCRCIWIAILKAQTIKPAFTRHHSRAGGVSQPPFTTYLQDKMK